MVLLVVTALVVNEYQYLPASSEIVALLEDNSTKLVGAGYLGLVSAALLLWFSGSLRAKLRAVEGGDGRLSTVAFGGGVAAAACFLVSHGALISAGARAGSDGGIDPGGAVALWDLYTTTLGNVAPVALGVLILATAVVGFRTGFLARWLTWVSLVLGVALLTPYAWAVIVVAVLWLAWMSVQLYREGLVTP